MVNLTPTELERYSRQMSLPNFGELAQKRLKSATVLVTGVEFLLKVLTSNGFMQLNKKVY